VYYTGSDEEFSSANLCGNLGGGIRVGQLAIGVEDLLQSGVNYFWLAVTISPRAENGNTIDATIDALVCNREGGFTIIPNVTDPDGYLIINNNILISYKDLGNQRKPASRKKSLSLQLSQLLQH